MPNNYLSVLYKHIIQVENKNVVLKVWGRHKHTIAPPNKKVGGGHMPPLAPPPPPRFLCQCVCVYKYVHKYIYKTKQTTTFSIPVLTASVVNEVE